MATPITGEQFIRTLRHYLEVNEHRLLSTPSTKKQPSIPEETTPKSPITNNESSGFMKAVSSLWSNNNNATSEASSVHSTTIESSNSRPNSIYGIPIPYMSLLSATSPNATSLSNIPYMPPRSSLTLDIHYLYFLLVQFEYLGLEDSHLPVPTNGLVETETTTNEPTNKAPSITSVGSVMSTLSLSTGWNIWSSQQKTHRPLHEDIVYIHRYLGQVSALKLHMNLLTDAQKGITRSGLRTIRGYELPLPQDGSVVLPLRSFKNLQFLELCNINPKCIDAPLQDKLTSLVIKAGNVDNAADVISEPWTQLKMLSFADNSITTLDAEPAQHIRSVSHLNLSSNLLIDIPAALSSLYNLSSLNLSHNMISFTTGINTILGNIQELDLRGNRLTVLAGLDRLWALERLDVRDNRIEDGAEIGRLTALPNIYDIWVEGNPFTKLQPDYRVELFSAFKKNDLEIELDGMKPTFNERRRIQVPQETKSATVSAKIASNLISTPPAATMAPSDTPAVEHDKGKKLARAKTRNNKRQIRLGHIEEDKPIPSAAMQQEEEEDKKYVHRLAELEDAVQQEAIKSRRAASVRSRRSKAPVETTSPEPAKPASDKFRKRIEAMRKEAGTEWLRVLQEMDVVKKETP